MQIIFLFQSIAPLYLLSIYKPMKAFLWWLFVIGIYLVFFKRDFAGYFFYFAKIKMKTSKIQGLLIFRRQHRAEQLSEGLLAPGERPGRQRGHGCIQQYHSVRR